MSEKQACDTKNIESEQVTRRDFVVLAAASAAGVGAAVAAVPFISSLAPDAGVLAVGSTEVDLSGIRAGETLTVMWRGKPIFVTHRTEAQIEEAASVELSELKDPEVDSARVHQGKEKWLVTVGVCTHLGCVPVHNRGDYAGWFCPCHGSHYDISGRIRKGPAPNNLEVPPYEFLGENKIKIG